MEPGQTKVMEPVLSSDLPRGPGYTYQVKWDGVRMLAFISQGSVILQNKKGNLKTRSFPELNCLAGLAGQPLVLDGELVVICRGRADFPQILRRNFARDPWPGAPAVSYVVFDLLCLAGQDLRFRSLGFRQETLAGLGLPQGPATLIDDFSDGEGLYALTKEKGWEGVVAKDLASPYRPGKSPSWLKIKNRRRDSFWVVGYVSRQGRLASLLLGFDFGQGIRFAGGVGSGLGKKGLYLLDQSLPMLALAIPPFPTAKIKGATWIKPVIEAQVEYMEWTEGLTLRAPVLKSLTLEGKEIAIH